MPFGAFRNPILGGMGVGLTVHASFGARRRGIVVESRYCYSGSGMCTPFVVRGLGDIAGGDKAGVDLGCGA